MSSSLVSVEFSWAPELFEVEFVSSKDDVDVTCRPSKGVARIVVAFSLDTGMLTVASGKIEKREKHR